MLNLLKQGGIKAVFRLTTARLKPSVRRQTGAAAASGIVSVGGSPFGQNDRHYFINLFNPQKIVIAGEIIEADKVLLPLSAVSIHLVKGISPKKFAVVRSTLDHRSAIGAFAPKLNAPCSAVLLLQRLLES